MVTVCVRERGEGGEGVRVREGCVVIMGEALITRSPDCTGMGLHCS